MGAPRPSAVPAAPAPKSARSRAGIRLVYVRVPILLVSSPLGLVVNLVKFEPDQHQKDEHPTLPRHTLIPVNHQSEHDHGGRYPDKDPDKDSKRFVLPQWYEQPDNHQEREEQDVEKLFDCSQESLRTDPHPRGAASTTTRGGLILRSIDPGDERVKDFPPE